MKKTKLAAIGISVLIGAVCFSGCSDSSDSGAANESTVKHESKQKNKKSKEKVNKDKKDDGTESPEESYNGTENIEKTDDSIADELWSQLKGQSFYFSSGAGAWETDMKFDDDGSFSGYYHDTDAGDTGTNYPNGTRYECEFRGKFTDVKKVNDYTYCVQLENIEQKQPSDKQEIVDGVKIIYSDPYGFENAGNFYIYLPGTPVSSLPQGYLSWVNMLVNNKSTLTFYGLYNENAGDGFAATDTGSGSIPNSDSTTNSVTDSSSTTGSGQASGIDDELKQIEAQAAVIEDKLQNDSSLTQSEMNTLSGDLYKLWDDELNSIWARLKDKLDESTMDQLTQEERQWISDKDEQVEAAGKEAEGGSLQPLLENDEAAEITKARVYELAQYLR